MKKIKFKSITKTRIADTVTPVGLYLKLRDKFANTLLLESSDYHSKEESFSFICIEPVATIKAENHHLSFSYKGHQLTSKKLEEGNFYDVFQEYTGMVDLDCDPSIKSFNGLYGYTTYDGVQYFENIEFTSKDAPSAIPLMQYSFFRFVIAINHFNDEMMIIENLEENEISRIGEIETIVKSKAYQTRDFSFVGQETSNCTDEDFKNYVTKGKEHCKRGDVFQIVLSRQFQQAYKGDEFNVYRALRSINPSPYLFYFDYGSFKLMGSSPEAQIKVGKERQLSIRLQEHSDEREI